MKHYKLVEFSSILYVKPPLHERKATPHKCKAPVLTTFWRRFWSSARVWSICCVRPSRNEKQL